MSIISLWSPGPSSISSKPSWTSLTCPGVTAVKEVSEGENEENIDNYKISDGTWANEKCYNPDSGVPFNESIPAMHNITEVDSETAVEQFWRYQTIFKHHLQLRYFCSNEVLNISEGIEEVGGIQLDLLMFLILAWVVTYCVIWKGLHNSGKVIRILLQSL